MNSSYMVHQPPANPAAMDTYLGDLTVVDGFEMDEDGFSLVPAPTVDLATAWCPPIQPGQRTVLLGLPFEILRAIMAYVAVNEKTKQINMKIIRRFSTMNSVLRAVALDFLFRNVTVPMRYKYHGDAAMVAGLAQNPHLLRHARSIFLKANSAWISHHGALVVGETGPRMPPDTLARLLGAMPLLTTLTLDEMLVDDEDYLLRACRDVLPRLTTLTLHVAHWNAPEELIAACTGLRTLRLNCNGHAKGPEPGDCDHIDMALAAAGGLPLLETLDMFKFAHQQEDLDVGERPIQVTVGWDVASIINIHTHLPHLKSLALYGNISDVDTSLATRLAQQFTRFPRLERLIMTKELMADWNLIEPSALSDADSTDSDGDTAGSDVAMTDVDAHADGASDADSDAASHVGGPCYTLLDERQLASPQPDTWGHDADAARLLCAACPALREVGFVFKERGTMFAPVRTPQGRVEDVVETGNWINHYFHMFVLGDPEEWKRVYWL